jgi:hypothetical protein
MSGVPPCHHSRARPRVADGWDGLQQWREAGNIMNRQPWKTTMGGPSAWGLGVGLTTLNRKKQTYDENLTKASDLDGFF